MHAKGCSKSLEPLETTLNQEFSQLPGRMEQHCKLHSRPHFEPETPVAHIVKLGRGDLLCLVSQLKAEYLLRVDCADSRLEEGHFLRSLAMLVGCCAESEDGDAEWGVFDQLVVTDLM